MDIAVLLIVFNRFDTAVQVLAQLRLAAVKKLYIYSDGPRNTKEGEKETLTDVQTKILAQIDWPCQIETRFCENNQGPRIAIGQAIDWFFEHEEEGIILEHDCVPNQSFFPYCKELLAYYRTDERIMHISGDNFQFGKWRGDGSYYFSKLNHIWGFATWRRAWKHYDVDMKEYPEFREKDRLNDILWHKRSIDFWQKTFDKTYSKEIETWDYQWTFAMWINNGLSIYPNKNLVSNVGFDKLALNTTNPNDKIARMLTQEMHEIIHPKLILHDQEADSYTMDEVFYPSLWKYAVSKLKELLNKN
ncbi:MAG: hypothetical protein CFE21_16910 [Bacteroidetes bacterium B1(2017)]|nr:MAG: hypothetical protein CFE21_16910 [Bacteroidetes bacterium B1(2017)]